MHLTHKALATADVLIIVLYFCVIFAIGFYFSLPPQIILRSESGRHSQRAQLFLLLHEAGDNLWLYIFRHAAGDWGDLSTVDQKLNAEALKEGTRLLSAYHLKDGTKIWLITEWDRSATTALLPEEY